MLWTAMIAALLMGGEAVTEPDREESGRTVAPHQPALRDALAHEDLVRVAEPLPGFADFAQPKPFGARGSRRWQIHGGGGVDIKTSRNVLGLVGVGVSYFIIDHLSLDAELNGLHFRQRGHDAVAANVSLLFRWHFLTQDTWSIYSEAGAGMMLATQPVPSKGTRFNFTPQLGFGASFEIASDTRLMTGVRWQHISNASLYSDNPGRDSVTAYIGVSFGF